MIESIEDLIRLGEDSVREFKSIRIQGKRVAEPDAREISDDFASAANASGTTFLFGVNDKTHAIEGVPFDKLEIAETWLRNICNDSVKPALPATIRKLAVRDSAGEERCVIRVDVPKSLFVHEGVHGYFYRIGSSKRKMSPEMLARLFQQRSQTRLVCFDEQVVSQAEVGELLAPLYTRFRTELSSADDSEFLRKLHFIAPDVDGVMRPTVAGVLFATEHPESYLPSAFIQAVCYRGVERNADYQLDARDITGHPEYKLLGDSELLLSIYSAPIDDRKKLRAMITSSGETTNSGRKTIKESGETIKSNSGVINKVGETINHAAETMCETISDTIKSNPGIALIGIVEKVGRSRATVARIVATLKKEGYVEYRGSKKTGRYFSIS